MLFPYERNQCSMAAEEFFHVKTTAAFQQVSEYFYFVTLRAITSSSSSPKVFVVVPVCWKYHGSPPKARGDDGKKTT